jgi:hypothetical protein
MSSTSVPHSDVASVVTCSSCGRNYSLADVGSLGSTTAERSARAAEFANQHGIDLASAYSVLLGILSVEAALSMSGGVHVAADPKASTYDPGFRNAVKNGTLTLHQAVQRGDRVVYASRLAQRHDLDMNLAFMLADNQIGLSEALRRRDAAAGRPDTSPDPEVPNVRRRPLPAVLTVALALLCGWGYWSGSWNRDRDAGGEAATPGLRSHKATKNVEASSAELHSRTATEAQDGTEAPAPARVSSPVEIVVDRLGAPTLVTGPDPRSVLEAFCSHPQNSARLSPRSLVPSAVRGSGDQIGLIEDYEHGSGMRAVVISRDPRSRRWRIGNGRTPIGLLDSVPVSASKITAGS